MKILITGAAGFIGSNLCHYFCSKGHIVFGIDNFVSGKRSNIQELKRNFNFVEGDIRSLNILERYVTEAEVVVHLAAMSSVANSFKDPSSFYETNVMGFVNLMEALRRNSLKGGKPLIYASSAAVYGSNEKVPVDESAAVNPLSPYALTKVINEQIAQSYSTGFGVSSVGLRFFNVYGPRQNPKSDYSGVISKWVDALKNGETPKIFGDGTQTRDFIHVDDICQVIESIINKGVMDGAKVFNVGTGKSVKILELFEAIKNAYPSANPQLKPEFLEGRIGEVKLSEANIDLIKNHYGFNPSVDLTSGLKTLF